MLAVTILLYSLQLVSAQQTTRVPPIASAKRKIINIGALFVKDDPTYIPFIGYEGSIAAFYLAIDRIRQNHLLDGYDFKYV
ncbi:unnamed protein product [Cylicostephanus goldi]|uniref:Receptor ligand binding region domain-containing protein n=1 Tax=Cylicostephanus goldi TaxID=71465 RepID=A0A3P7MYW3_CYLGO|nr:unnamed protein product [Cylicostephanus goldi]